jgi:hypothetical protein
VLTKGVGDEAERRRRRRRKQKSSSLSQKNLDLDPLSFKKTETASSSKSSPSSSLKPITMGACLMLAALQARHLWQERPSSRQGQAAAASSAESSK